MKFNFVVCLLAITLATAGMLGFAAFNIPEAKAQGAKILVGGPVSGSGVGTWSGWRGNRTATVGSVVRYTVNITDVTELWTFDFTLAWGMTVLEFKNRTLRVPQQTYSDGILNSPPAPTKIRETSVIAGGEANRTAVYNLVYSQSSTATPWTWVAGKGCAVYLNFVVLTDGECDVYFLDSKLSYKNGTAIPHTQENGYFYYTGHKRVPTASYTVGPATKIANKTSVSFNAGGSSDPDAGGPLSYIWTFGQSKPKIPAIESPHPYPTTAKLNYTLTHTSAIRMRLFFPNITLDSGDIIRIRDKNNVIQQSFTTSFAPPGVWTNWVKGDTININLTTDGDANVGWGFKADHYNLYLQVAASTTTYTYTILQSDYSGAPYGPYPFTTSLSVVDAEHSQSKTVSSNIQIVHPRPVAEFTFSPNITHYHPAVNWAYIFCGKTVNFDASSSYDPDPAGGILWYFWDFGDGTQRNLSTPTTSYSFAKQGGVMGIGLTVKDTSDGLQSYFSYAIRVYNVTEFARAYGATEGTPPYIPPSPNWNSFYEIISDRTINATDLQVIGKSYY